MDKSKIDFSYYEKPGWIEVTERIGSRTYQMWIAANTCDDYSVFDMHAETGLGFRWNDKTYDLIVVKNWTFAM